MGEKAFYRAFEDRYRGSRDLIRRRLEVYLPFVEPLLRLYSEAKVVDLGCGRGEWLELTGERGFQAVGVDLDEGMLLACTGLGLTVLNQEALAFLRALPDESQCVVSGFHVAEHIPFSHLQELVSEALRVLMPGGVLILETPNPENVAVGTSNFYLDPTHQRPIPPLLLEFLTEYSGFERVRILRLQEQSALVEKESVELIDVLNGVSPDYSVIAQKAAESTILAAFDGPFGKVCGLELAELANRFDAKLERRFEVLETRLSEAEGAADHLARNFDRFTAADEIAKLTNWARESEKFALSQGRELSHAREQLEKLRRSHAEETNRLTERARELDEVTRERETELSRAREELEKIRRTHAEEIARLTVLARESEAFARAQETDLSSAREQLEKTRKEHEEEVARLTALARESEAFARAQEAELLCAREELERTRTAHEEEVARLTTLARESDGVARARSTELDAARRELKASALAREEDAKSAEKEIGRLSGEIEALSALLEEYAKFWIFRLLPPPVARGSKGGAGGSEGR